MEIWPFERKVEIAVLPPRIKYIYLLLGRRVYEAAFYRNQLRGKCWIETADWER